MCCECGDSDGRKCQHRNGQQIKHNVHFQISCFLKEKLLVVTLVPSKYITKILLAFCVGEIFLVREVFFPRDLVSLLGAKALTLI